jgi:hypothetical protein
MKIRTQIAAALAGGVLLLGGGVGGGLLGSRAAVADDGAGQPSRVHVTKVTMRFGPETPGAQNGYGYFRVNIPAPAGEQAINGGVFTWKPVDPNAGYPGAAQLLTSAGVQGWGVGDGGGYPRPSDDGTGWKVPVWVSFTTDDWVHFGAVDVIFYVVSVS